MKTMNAIALAGFCVSSLLVGCSTEMRDEILYGKSSKQVQTEKKKSEVVNAKMAAKKENEEYVMMMKKKKQAKDEKQLTEFLGMKFGDVMDVPKDTKVLDGFGRWIRICVPFVPKKPLPGFDLYEVELTPVSHRICRIKAGRKVENDSFPEGKQIMGGLKQRYGLKWEASPLFGNFTMEFGNKQRQYIHLHLFGLHKKRKDPLSMGYEDKEFIFYAGTYVGDTRLSAMDSDLVELGNSEYKTLEDQRRQEEKAAQEKEAAKVKDLF